MQDLAKRVENDVKMAIAEACTALGIDKNEVSWYVGGGGVISPQVVRNPETGEQAIAGFAPTWMVGIGLRSLLLGREPVVGSLPIHDVMPTAPAIKQVVFKVMSDVDTIRREQFKGNQ